MTAIPEACICWSCLLLLQREAGLADVEIIARVQRRRKWTAQEKAALLAEVEAEGGKVTIVAQRHRIAESVLDNWRAAWKAAAAMMQTPMAPAVADRTDANVLELLGGQRGQNLDIDVIRAECRPILVQTKSAQPIRDVHRRCLQLGDACGGLSRR
jgi:Transposase